MNWKMNWDAMGITTSVICAVHCAVLPLLVASLPVFGLDIIKNSIFEYGMIGMAFLVGIFALQHGYRKHHHKPAPLVLFTVGILFLFAKQIWHSYHTWLLVPAVLCIITAHYLNYSFSRISEASAVAKATA